MFLPLSRPSHLGPLAPALDWVIRSQVTIDFSHPVLPAPASLITHSFMDSGMTSTAPHSTFQDRHQDFYLTVLIWALMSLPSASFSFVAQGSRSGLALECCHLGPHVSGFCSHTELRRYSSPLMGLGSLPQRSLHQLTRPQRSLCIVSLGSCALSQGKDTDLT